MLEAIGSGLAQLANPVVIGAMLLGLPLGLIIGLLPGLSGITAFAFLIPFTFGMSPLVGLGLPALGLCGGSQGGSMTAIILGVPGEVPNAATVIDGYEMTKQGRAGEAIGAALMGSALGGLFGCVLLADPAADPAADHSLVCFAGKFLPGACRRLLHRRAVVGLAGQGPDRRRAWHLHVDVRLFADRRHPTLLARHGIIMLDGFRLVPLALGLFAVPEIFAADDHRQHHHPEPRRVAADLAARGDARAACRVQPPRRVFPLLGDRLGDRHHAGCRRRDRAVRRLCHGQTDLAQSGNLRHRPHRGRDRAGKLEQRQGGRRAGADAWRSAFPAAPRWR